mmetsp:Transcript_41640/g.163513  ORF Transcript_41640/g.163513 Transcript_41640/m.163513 type:complete len:358 (-) Transcript_41640:1449-2522(-)
MERLGFVIGVGGMSRALNSARVCRGAKIHEAAKEGRVNDVRELIESGVDVDERDEEGWTALMWGSRVADLEVVKLLHTKGADLMAKNDKGSTSLHHASHWQSEPVVRAILSWLSEGEGVNEQNSVGWTPLHWAAKAGSSSITKLLLDSGSSVNVRHVLGATPLHEATNSGDVEVAQLLLDAGADVNMTSSTGATPLLSAAYMGSIELCELFIDAGGSLAIRDEGGDTPLICAARGGFEDVVEMLIERGASVNEKNKIGWTALHEACRWGRDDVVDILVAHENVNLEHQNESGETALHLAAMYGASYGVPDIIESLVEAGASVDALDTSGKTPTDIVLLSTRAEKDEVLNALKPRIAT